VLARFVKSLAAVLIGNTVYFLVVMPRLPSRGRHEPFRLDVGLLVDFWLCLVAYGVLELILRRRQDKRTD
jgi:hypothetical protein